MPACLKTPRVGLVILLISLLTLAGCSDPAADGRFELTRVQTQWTNGRLNVTSEHGVPLTLELELRLRSANSQTRVASVSNSYEISYLPLIDQYQLAFSDDTPVRTFPRLRHVLSELSRLSISVTTGALPAGDYELLARMHLDQNSMPPPMRLPVLLSSKWRHDSSWSAWPLEIEPEV